MQNTKYYVIKGLYFRDGKTTGSLWEREPYPDGGSVNRLLGCRYIGQAFELSKELLPGDRINLLEGVIQTLAGDSGSWDCLIIGNFEKINLNERRE